MFDHISTSNIALFLLHYLYLTDLLLFDFAYFHFANTKHDPDPKYMFLIDKNDPTAFKLCLN